MFYVLDNDENCAKKEEEEDSTTQEEGKMPSFTVLLHGSLKVEGMVALTRVSLVYILCLVCLCIKCRRLYVTSGSVLGFSIHCFTILDEDLHYASRMLPLIYSLLYSDERNPKYFYHCNMFEYLNIHK